MQRRHSLRHLFWRGGVAAVTQALMVSGLYPLAPHAWRVLVRNGPTGGDVDDVEMKHTVIASVDPVAVDAYAAQAWWNLPAPRVRYLRLAEERGLGKMDFASLRTVTAAL